MSTLATSSFLPFALHPPLSERSPRMLSPLPSPRLLRASAAVVRRFCTSPQVSYANAQAIHTARPLTLHSIRDNEGARKPEVRLGRGRGSGCGKTSGRGQKGRRARGSVPLGFEGGQTPLQKRLPKRCHYDPFQRHLSPVTLGRVQEFIDKGRIIVREGEEITMRELVRSGCVGKPKDGIVLVEGGTFVERVRLQVTECEVGAAAAVVGVGGKVTLAWYNTLGLLALLRPERWAKKGLPLPRWARPPPKFEHRYLERTEDGLPVRTLESMEDVQELESSWKRIIHPRAKKSAM